MLARAKVNLALHVTGRRSDGYHRLDTLVAFPPVGDEIIAVPAEAFSLTLEGPFASLLEKEKEADNLILTAAKGMARLYPGRGAAAFTLVKRLPVAAGLGGGSADAAAALRLLARAWHVALDDPAFLALSQGLGADVPMCLMSRPLRAQGIGETLTPLPSLPSLGIVLVNPNRPLSTAAVFAALQSKENPPLATPPPVQDRDRFLAFLREARNDLETPAIGLFPLIETVLDRLRRLEGVRLVRMSGSGPTCFALFDTHKEAQAAAMVLRRSDPEWWIADTFLHEPFDPVPTEGP